MLAHPSPIKPTEVTATGALLQMTEPEKDWKKTGCLFPSSQRGGFPDYSVGWSRLQRKTLMESTT